MTSTHYQHESQSRLLKTLLLIGVVIVLAIIPLFIHPESEFGGTDGQGSEVISQIQPDVQPWFTPFWEPPGSETESLLFALQAAIGAGVIGYFFGVKQGARQRNADDEHDTNNAHNKRTQ